jgi:hypothetical protein
VAEEEDLRRRSGDPELRSDLEDRGTVARPLDEERAVDPVRAADAADDDEVSG